MRGHMNVNFLTIFQNFTPNQINPFQKPHKISLSKFYKPLPATNKIPICLFPWPFRRNLCCLILDFRRYVEEMCGFLSFYPVYIDNSLPTFGTTFRPHLQKARNPRPLKMEPTVCSETSVMNYRCTLRNNPDELRSSNSCLFHTPVVHFICIPLHLLWFICHRVRKFNDKKNAIVQSPCYVILLPPSVKFLFLGSVVLVLCNQTLKIKGQIWKEV